MIALCVLLLPGLALGAQSPLQETSRNRVIYPESGNVALISYYATLTVRGSTSVNAYLTLSNTGDTPVGIDIGMPYPLDHNYQVDNAQAWCEGQALTTRRLTRDPDGPAGMPEKWYGWELEFAPGQTRVLAVSYSTDTKIEPDGTRSVTFPLYYLRAFAGQTGYVQVVADMDYYPPYVYDPSPTPMPQQVDSAGSLTWTFPDGEVPDEIVLRFKPTAQVIERYLEQRDQDAEVAEILSLYEKSQYVEASDRIDGYLAAHDGYEYKNALLTVKSLCLQKLMRLDEAMDLLNYLAPDPGFGDMNASFQNRIIYETAWIMGATEESPEEILEYLTARRDQVDTGTFFGQWMDQEIWRLTPRPTPVPEPTSAPAAVTAPETPQKGDWFGTFTEQTVKIGSLAIPLLYLLGGGIVLVIVVLLVVIIRSSGRRRRGRYRFR